MTNPIIAFQNVSKVFEDSGTQVLKDINFELEEGKFYTLLGASGSGKSTILNIIAGLLDATSGDVLLDGKRINDIPINKRDVHTVFQSYALFPHMNVFDNVAFALKLKKVPKKEIEERVKEALKMVQLDGYQKRSIQKLSGGQRQRVAIARALANDPEILISDESTSALDPKTTKQILSLLQDLNKKLGLTVVMITHEMQIVKDICNRVAVMQNGQLLEEGSVLDIFSNPQEDLTQEFIETAAGIEDALAKINAQPLVKNLPASALLVQLKYVGSSTDRPLLTEIFKDFGVSGNILYGNVEILGDTPVGELVVVLDGDSDKVIAALKAIENAGVSLRVLKKGAQ